MSEFVDRLINSVVPPEAGKVRQRVNAKKTKVEPPPPLPEPVIPAIRPIVQPLGHDCSNEECEDGYIPNPDWCGDEDHCDPWIPCPQRGR